MIFKWKDTVHPNVSADVAGKVCSDLEKNGRLNASNLVEVSRSEDAPLHKVFEWNNEKAGELYREHQARNIINCLVVTGCSDDGSTDPVRAFFKVEPASNKYESIIHIVTDEEKYASLLEQAKKELKSFKTKYESLKELKSVLDAIEQIAM